METRFAGTGRHAALLGRARECAALDDLISAIRGGEGRALVIRGEAGIGKTALLKYLVEAASGVTVVRAVGVESEMELAYAGLHLLCSGLLDRLSRLPIPQRRALEIVFGLSDGAPPDRFLVGLAILGLLSEVAEERPVLCVVDDMQWLDQASALTLAFVARRLRADPVGIVFALREPGEELSHVPELEVRGLVNGDARALLNSSLGFIVDRPVREQVVAETRGNPLALLELTRGLSAGQLAGGFGLPGALSLAGRVEERFLQRLQAVPEDSRRLLLVAAADPTGDPALLWRAAERLGMAGTVLDPVAAAGLLEVGSRVRFRHPLVRSAVYRAAAPEQRRDAHRALAEATDGTVDPDRRAWHLAEAAAGPDEEVADELERAAARALARGGLTAAAAFLERATTLTLEPSRRADRALAAAQRKIQGGALDAIPGLLALAQAGPLSELQQARLDQVRGQLAFVSNRGSSAAALLLNAAKRLEPIAPELARAAYTDAMYGALFAAHLAAPGSSLRDVALAASAGSRQAPAAEELFLDGVAATFGQGYAAGVPLLRRALRAFGGTLTGGQELRRMSLAFLAASHLWDDDDWERISDQWATLCREEGAISELPLSLNSRAMVLVFAGDLDGGDSLVQELKATTEATGIASVPYGAMFLAALQGREAELSRLTEATAQEAMARGQGLTLAITALTMALLYNGLGRYESALAVAREVSELPDQLGTMVRAVAELVEAAVRCGELDLAERALERLEGMARATCTDWALGVAARSRALLSDGEIAENSYREAIERLERTRVRVELARAHLVYGEWLRREGRLVDARERLRVAHDMLSAMGIEAFAGRARMELLATGEKVRKRTVETVDELTEHERQIARLAGGGFSNAEIGSRLFLSPRTIEWHLSKVFGKLGVSSRKELSSALSDVGAVVPSV